MSARTVEEEAGTCVLEGPLATCATDWTKEAGAAAWDAAGGDG